MTDNKLKRVAIGFRRGVIGRRSSRRKCFAVCAPLGGYLSAVYGLETKLVEVDFKLPWSRTIRNHVFLELKDGRILDPTADQFVKRGERVKLRQVYLGPMPKIYTKMIEAAKLQTA